MGKKKTDKSVFDIGVEIADEIGDDDLKVSLRQLRDHQSLQKARAEAVLQELTSGLPDNPNQADGIDYLDYVIDRLNNVIAVNLDANSIYEFLLLCSNHIGSLTKIATAQIARSELARSGALAKIAADPKQKDKAVVRECWDDWQKVPDRYKGKAAFARDMLDKFPNLESQPVIEGWCRAWEREN